jgi:hypothetical protein
MMWKLLAVTFGCSTAGLAVSLVWQLIAHARLRRRFSGILDIELEIATRQAAFEARLAKQTTEIERAREKVTHELADTLRTTRELRAHHATSKAAYDRLRAELAVLERSSDDFSCGLYEPVFTFPASDDYKRRLREVREEQKTVVHADRAIQCNPTWTFGESRKVGARLQRQHAKALLRAFNGEGDAAIARVTWNNITRTIERVKLAFEAINKLGSEIGVELTTRYRDLKLEELRLEHELAQKRHAEQEEQREVRALLREEMRAQLELEQVRTSAEAEELRAQVALDHARDELGHACAGELDDRLGAMAALQDALHAAQQRTAHAAARAQQVLAGYVYVASNIGSFGDTVYKIGMTRRLDPIAHVRELGDGALPFDYDVHALIRSEDAPALEAKLHHELHDRRLNLVDPRRAFFHATLDEIVAFAKREGAAVQVTRHAEAQQYRESNALRRQRIAPAGTGTVGAVGDGSAAITDAGGFAFPLPSDEVDTMPVRLSVVPASSAERLISSWASDRARPVAAPAPAEMPID